MKKPKTLLFTVGTLSILALSLPSLADIVRIPLTGTASGITPAPEPGADETPNAFSFAPVTGAAANQPIISQAVTITGIDVPVAVAISGQGLPLLRINGGSSVSSGTVSEGDQIEVSLVPDDWEASFAATLTVGTAQAVFSVATTIEPVSASLAPSPGALSLTQGQPFNFDFQSLASISGGPKADPAALADLTWSVGSGASPLPSGLTLNPATGVLSGSPSTSGNVSVEVVAAYAGAEARQTYSLTIEPGVEPVLVSLADAPAALTALQNQAFSYDFKTLATVSGGQVADPATVSDLVWSVGAGASPLPDGLSLNTTTGVLSGTPTTIGSTSFEMVGSYLDGQAEKIYTITVNGVVLNVRQISAGQSNTCVIMADRSVKCWGLGTSGQLGNGGTASSNVPVTVVGISNAESISVGSGSSCVLTTSGGMKCWGLGSSGRLGTGGTTSSSTPVDVLGLTSGVSKMSVGVAYACALLDTGGVKCWGNGLNGKIGNGGTVNQLSPVDVSGLTSGVVAISTGHQHACALMDTGALKCWGDNASGQLGNGTIDDSSAPVDVTGLGSGVVSMSAGVWNTCALKSSGELMCWGSGSAGSNGTGTSAQALVPVQATVVTETVASFSVGENFVCYTNSSGALKCWGTGSLGQLGDGLNAMSTTPVTPVGMSSGVTSFDVGEDHVCAHTSDGVMKCWGSNVSGMLGTGDTANKTTPTQVNL